MDLNSLPQIMQLLIDILLLPAEVAHQAEYLILGCYIDVKLDQLHDQAGAERLDLPGAGPGRQGDVVAVGV